MLADRRLWRTGDGRLVQDGDPDAATLAYKAGDRIEAADEAKVPRAQDDTAAAEEQAGPAAKARARPANKARGRGEDK